MSASAPEPATSPTASPSPPSPPSPPNDALRRAVAGSVVGKTVELATLVLLATVVPRLLGPTDYGRFSVALTLVTLGALALTLGGPIVMARFVPAAPAHERVAVARAIGLRLARGRTVQVAVITFVVLGVALADPDVLDPLEALAVVLAFALNVLASLALQVALGLGRTVAWSLRFPIQNSVLVVGLVALYPAMGISGAFVAILLSAVAAAIFATAVVARVAGGRHPRAPLPDGALRFGVLQAAAAALVQVAQRGGVVAVALLSTTTQVGFAALPIGIVLGATYAILQAFTVSLPHLSEHSTALGSTTSSEATLRRLAWLALAVLVPALGIVAVGLDELVPAVFGSDFAGAEAAFGPALALLVLAPLTSLLTQTSALRLRPVVALASASVGIVAFVAVAVATIPAWGAEGGTAAALAAGAVGGLVSTRMLPGAARPPLVVASYVGAAAVLGLALT